MIKNFFNYQKRINLSLFVKLNNSMLINKNFENLTLPKKGNLLKINNSSKSDTIVICQGADILNEIFKIKEQLKSIKNVSIFAAVWLNKINKQEILKLNNKKILIFQSATNFGSL